MEKVSILCAHSSVNRWPISANQFLRNSAMHPMESKQIITKFMNKLLFVETVNSHHIYALVYNWPQKTYQKTNHSKLIIKSMNKSVCVFDPFWRI